MKKAAGIVASMISVLESGLDLNNIPEGVSSGIHTGIKYADRAGSKIKSPNADKKRKQRRRMQNESRRINRLVNG